LNAKPTLLIVDDDRSNLESYSLGFARQPYRVLTANGGVEALSLLRTETIDAVLTDLKMPDVDGLAVVRAAASLPVPPGCIVITAYGTIESAVEAMRHGAFDYITKPVNLLELRAKVEKALEVRTLRLKNEDLQGLLNQRFRFEGVIGVSKEMQEIIEQARTAADSRISVLIEGESGTGKELLARAIHFNSPRAGGPFVPIHCAAIPETLLESELFGHEKGAFTGAVQRRIGQFESAHGGTVFLDEVSDISPAVQVKLLRVLEQREIVRVGSTQPIALDIRLVAATNKDLAQEVGEGRFREDLYYRLNVVRIRIPALRQRPADIPPLVHHYLQTLARENNRSPLQISGAALQCLVNYAWPGNIRQLRNVMEQLVVFSRSEVLGLKDLPPPVRESTGELNEDFSESADNISDGAKTSGSSGEEKDELVLDAKMSLDEIERRYILYTLARMKDNRTRAAERLGISRRTLQRKLKELGADDHNRGELSREETE